MDIKILLQALNQPWFIQPEAAEYHALVLHQMITGQSASMEDADKPVAEFAFAVNAAGQKISTIQDASDNGVAVINIRGAIMKYDYCGAPGTQSMMRALQQANDNPAISAVLLQIDSPGGSVAGTQQFADAIKNSAKPVVAFVNGMMCSAAMWIGSAATERIASSNTDVIGSIGTMASWNDFRAYYESKGIKTHEVYASASTHKNLQFREANGANEEGKPNYEPLIKTWLDPLNSEFTGAIQQNLPGVDNTVLNGSHYIAAEAKKKGLINKIGTFESAVRTALALGKKTDKQKTDNSMKWNKILGFLGIASIASAQDVKLEDNQLDNLEAAIDQKEKLSADLATANAALATATTDAATKDAQITTITSQLNTANTTIGTLQTELTTANTRITDLEALSGKSTTTVKTEDKFEDRKTDAMEMAFQKALTGGV
ncbi:MAG: S49 family peptidase [Segetibacter sp.]